MAASLQKLQPKASKSPGRFYCPLASVGGGAQTLSELILFDAVCTPAQIAICVRVLLNRKKRMKLTYHDLEAQVELAHPAGDHARK